MNGMLKVALAAAAVLVAGVACAPATVAPSSSATSAVAPSPVAQSPEPSSSDRSASPTTAAVQTGPIDTTTWVTYVSARYGLSIKHPVDWHVDPSDHVWTLAKDLPSFTSSALEHFTGVDSVNGDVRVSAWSVAVEPGITLEDWIAAYCPLNADPCTGIKDRAVPVYAEPRDRHPGVLVPFDEDAYAFFLNGGRIYVVAVWRPEHDLSVRKYGGSRRLLEAFALTMCLGCGAPEGTNPPAS